MQSVAQQTLGVVLGHAKLADPLTKRLARFYQPTMVNSSSGSGSEVRSVFVVSTLAGIESDDGKGDILLPCPPTSLLRASGSL